VVSLVFLEASLLASPVMGRGQEASNGRISDRLASLRPGHWIQVEGILQPDGSVLCSKVDLLTGDFLDDDWSLRGTVQLLDSARREFTIGGCRVHLTENTRFEHVGRNRDGLSRLRPGMLVEVEGTYVRSRQLLAREIDDETDEIAGRSRVRNLITVDGKIEKVDPRRRVIETMGLTFRIMEKTRIRSVVE